MDREENGEDGDEECWWELWDRRRLKAVVQVICHIVYAVYLSRVYCSRRCDGKETLAKGRKRKACEWGRELESIGEAIRDVAGAIREGNGIRQRARELVYSEEQVFAELVKLGVEKQLCYRAYAFLVEDHARGKTRVRVIFSGV
ncbi:hypothetical protein Tsubulata_029385 [Turnera subulata]|uniref:Uncharacterized protein n=1 Tax=Turnera subulata TaxID=218843 RepID=A0A9Q0F8I5_9ROSI|nr:hypothetical protein Tsubulata_029385 [Turnera subulata]